jgi:transposase
MVSLSCSSWRCVCQLPFPSRFGGRFFELLQQRADPHEIVAHYRISLRSVQRLGARFEQRGEKALMPDYTECGAYQAVVTPASLVEQICQTRRNHPRWGSEMIRLELASQEELPCSRTLRRYLRKAGLQAAPAGRTPSAERTRVPRAQRPHQGWQTDAAEQFHLQGGRQACWLRFVDECSGAFLKTIVFSTARWENVDRHEIQDKFREVFSGWGLPARLRVDNGYPWGSSGDFPPELALWLIGLGIEMIWIWPGCPQENGVVERAQGTGKRWAEPPACRNAGELQRRCDEMDRRQREDYPYQGSRSRWEVYPELHHSGRRYSRRWEGSHWDLSRVLAVVSRQVVKREVDASGSVSLYHRTRYVGKPQIGDSVYVHLDPTGPTWVFADAKGNQLRTHPADELTPNRIRSLTVGCRKGKRA